MQDFIPYDKTVIAAWALGVALAVGLLWYVLRAVTDQQRRKRKYLAENPPSDPHAVSQVPTEPESVLGRQTPPPQKYRPREPGP